MTAEQLSAVAGIIVSLLFSYVPGVSDWYQARTGTEKRLIMAVLLLVIAAGSFGLSCGRIVAAVTCEAGALTLINALIAALVANQSTFLLSPKRR